MSKLVIAGLVGFGAHVFLTMVAVDPMYLHYGACIALALLAWSQVK